ncbi:MAG: sugar phosphate isomerase/epimerase [Clostridia bacterium]|nr:sugar phosphate isomerase/epimerase [Clostridia bacterium]
MKLASSTGDFSFYVPTIAEKVRAFKGLKFKYINLEQTGNVPELFSDNDADYLRLAEDFAAARDFAGVEYVVSHAPCLNIFDNADGKTPEVKIRAIRRSIEICHILGINRIVVHACPSPDFTVEQFYEENKKFYSNFFDLMEKYNIEVLTENWDNNATHITTGKEIRDFLDYVGHPLLGACWDTAHGNIDGVARKLGQYQNIIDIGDKLKGMHISDNFGDSHHHSWPFAGRIKFDSVMQGLLDVNYDGYFTFEASYTLLHHNNPPYGRGAWTHNGETVTKLLDPSIELKKMAVDLLYETGKYILETYGCYEA